MPMFNRYIGIDYSGAQTPQSSLPGLRIHEASPCDPPKAVPPPPSPRKHWTRRGIARWLATELREGPPTLVGIDHGFSFPTRYFEAHQLPPNWDAFLDDFCHHWPTDDDLTYVDFVRNGSCGNAAAREGNSRWRRLAEMRGPRAKSVFHFNVQGSVAKSTHAGIPWLRYLRRELGQRLHFWPFDGWNPPKDRPVIAEVYPSLWNRSYPRENRSPDEHDAYSVTRWMRETDAAGKLPSHFNPPLTDTERTTANLEGWILGLS